MKDNLVSIIIPTYNRAHIIGETLDSVLSQTYENWECIVVDDDSTDNTSQLIGFYCGKDRRIKYYNRPKETLKGANSCRNYGFVHSEGVYVQWLDSDDLLHPYYLEEKLNKFNDHYDLCICNADFFTAKKDSPFFISRNYSSSSTLLIDYITGEINMNIPVVLWKRDFVENFRFDEGLSRAQELDFHFRILKSKKVKAAFIDKVLVSIRDHSESITGNYVEGDKKSLISELNVRKSILIYILETGEPQEKKLKSLLLYLQGIRKLYEKNQFNILWWELHLFEKDVKIKKTYNKWKRKLLFFIFLYKITGREYRLKKSLYKLEDHVWF